MPSDEDYTIMAAARRDNRLEVKRFASRSQSVTLNDLIVLGEWMSSWLVEDGPRARKELYDRMLGL